MKLYTARQVAEKLARYKVDYIDISALTRRNWTAFRPYQLGADGYGKHLFTAKDVAILRQYFEARNRLKLLRNRLKKWNGPEQRWED